MMNAETILNRLGVAITLAITVCAIVLASREGPDFWKSSDQRGQDLAEQNDWKSAAETFTDPFRRGEAQFRSGDFKGAASTFAGLPGNDALFNHANSRVMLGEYDKAVRLYDQLLVELPEEELPEREDATTNRAIAAGRAERLRDEGGEMTGGMLGADEIVFNDSPTGQGGDPVETQDAPMNDQEMRTMWLRQVETSPGDFLRAKFAFQRARQESVPASTRQPPTARSARTSSESSKSTPGDVEVADDD
ncbi:MAG: tetratricopeptide repeat protein [Planctomycetota bacterium]